jgi:hypothetical protein
MVGITARRSTLLAAHPEPRSRSGIQTGIQNRGVIRILRMNRMLRIDL